MGKPELKLGVEILVCLGMMLLYVVFMILEGPLKRLNARVGALETRLMCRLFGHRMKPVYQTFYGWTLDHVVGHRCERCKVGRDV